MKESKTRVGTLNFFNIRVYAGGMLVLAVLLAIWIAHNWEILAWPLGSRDAILAAMLFVFLILAQYYPLAISLNVKIVVNTSLIYASILLLPLPWSALVVGAGVALGHEISRRPHLDGIINAGTSMLAAEIAQIVFVLAGGHIPPASIDLKEAGALSLAALVLFLTERWLAAVSVAIYAHTRPWTVFRSVWNEALREEIALFLLGFLTVLVVQIHLWAILLTAVPIALVYISLRNSLQLRVLTRDAVEKMADVIDHRDPYTAGHSIRVSELATRIAQEMRLPWEEIQLIRAAARVHDLGKIEIDSNVLRKPGRFDDREWELMRRHPIVGAEIISRFPEFARGADYIRYHHERWDGRGYPYGLKGEEIPLGARIIAVADSYDAMATDRPYRKALSTDVIRRELARGAGVQWDPEVVAAFFRVMGWDEETTAPEGVPALA